AAYNTIANGGVYVAPKLVKATVDADGKEHATPPSERRRVVSEQTSDEVRAMLNEVVRLGTGKLAAIDGYSVAGKTGTAAKPLENARGYKEGASYSTFAGFVPSEDPALTAIVVLDEPTPIYGGIVSAPVFAQVTRYGLREFRVAPPPPAARPTNVPAANPAIAAQGSGVDVAAVPGAAATAPPPSTTSTTAARPTSTTSTSTKRSKPTKTTPATALTAAGVTGTNGKTTVTHLLRAVFEAHGWPAAVIGTLSGSRTTPEGPDLQAQLASLRDGGTKAVALEVSSHALAQSRVDGIDF